MEPIFESYRFGTRERAEMDHVGHVVFPGLLTESAQRQLTEALAHIQRLKDAATGDDKPNHFAAERDAYLESLIGHPQMLALARSILGDDIRWDHCVSLNRPPGHPIMGWHTHGYGEENPDLGLGFIRIFFYVNGFDADDGGLKVVPGSHLYKDRTIKAADDAALEEGWLAGKTHPVTGEPLRIERPSVPPGTVIAMWTHALHGVAPRVSDTTRWCVVYAYRNPGLPSRARWITEAFEKKAIPGAKGLLSLY